MPNHNIDQDEAVRGFEVIREVIEEVCLLDDEATSLYLLTTRVRDQIASIIASIVEGRQPPIRKRRTWPLRVALTDTDERPAFLCHTMKDASEVEQAFELIDVYDSVIHDPGRWAEFHNHLRELERVLLARYERTA